MKSHKSSLRDLAMPNATALQLSSQEQKSTSRFVEVVGHTPKPAKEHCAQKHARASLVVLLLTISAIQVPSEKLFFVIRHCLLVSNKAYFI